MTDPLRIGVIGCGNISKTYLELAPLFPALAPTLCADLNQDAANARAAEFGLTACSVDALLASNMVDIVLNLTIPAAHYDISRRALLAGKHIYSEKPFVLSVEDGKALARMAETAGLRVGSAPDTFLGGSHQLARRVIDDGMIGKVTSGTTHVMGRGMEHWHPNPDFFFLEGGGPVLDMGPYYITNLIQLLGPITRVTAMGATPQKTRTILSEPRNGQQVPVETPTTLHALLAFESGALITFGASWDVKQHGHAAMELYGENGTLHLPDPNWFGGDVVLMRDADTSDALPDENHPFGAPNVKDGLANYRAAGLADMAQAIAQKRPHRCALELALHAVEAMTAILQSAETGAPVTMTTTCARPAPLTAGEATTLLGTG